MALRKLETIRGEVMYLNDECVMACGPVNGTDGTVTIGQTAVLLVSNQVIHVKGAPAAVVELINPPKE